MQNLIKFPLLFLLIASLIGLTLRWHYFQPIPGFQYTYWLHAHSHVMFLGWVFNALSIGFVIHLLPEYRHSSYKRIFYVLNALVAGMLITFPLQGYGVYSIAVSTLHTVAVTYFCFRFFKDTRDTKQHIGIWMARIALIFFLISAVGPFVVGILAANGLGQSDWYHLAVYYYLHFQYNGVFTFGVFALFFALLAQNGIHLANAKTFGILLMVSCFPAYALSALWTNPPIGVHVIGLLAAVGQLLALYYLCSGMRHNWALITKAFSLPSKVLLTSAGVAFIIKLGLQLLSVHPRIAMLAYEIRFYVIAYLHLVLIGMVSLFLLAWYNEKAGKLQFRMVYVVLIVVGFLITELIMITVTFEHGFNVSKTLAYASLPMIIGIAGITLDAIRMKSSYNKVRG